jgi:outer membrane protein OmpA-like peptidoglycan-associated protein
MALHAALPRPALRVWWAALVVVPLALAALGLPLFPPLPAPLPAPRLPLPVPVSAAPAVAEGGGITFAADEADLVGPSAVAVNRAAQLLGAGPGPLATVTGYAADTPGPAVVAQRLSERRAQAVVDALAAAGVRRERLVAVGRGAADPLPTPALSRRVEISVG